MLSRQSERRLWMETREDTERCSERRKSWKPNRKKKRQRELRISLGHIEAGTNLQTSLSSEVLFSCRMDPCWVLTGTAVMPGRPAFLLCETVARTWSRH